MIRFLLLLPLRIIKLLFAALLVPVAFLVFLLSGPGGEILGYAGTVRDEALPFYPALKERMAHLWEKIAPPGEDIPPPPLRKLK